MGWKEVLFGKNQNKKDGQSTYKNVHLAKTLGTLDVKPGQVFHWNERTDIVVVPIENLDTYIPPRDSGILKVQYKRKDASSSGPTGFIWVDTSFMNALVYNINGEVERLAIDIPPEYYNPNGNS